jgi:hypothetical protein
VFWLDPFACGSTYACDLVEVISERAAIAALTISRCYAEVLLDVASSLRGWHIT